MIFALMINFTKVKTLG